MSKTLPTILHRLSAWADSDPQSTAQSYKKGSEWKAITAREFADRVYWLALYLESRGMKQQDIGTLLSYNCPEWVHMDLASLLIGAKAAGIYPNSTHKDILYILNHTESRFLAVQNKEYFQKLSDGSGGFELPSRIELVLVFDGDTSISPKAVSYESAIAQGKKLAADTKAKKLKTYLDQLNPDAGAFMIYTSGTTGTPKGAVLSHTNLVYTIDIGMKHWDISDVRKGSLFSFLPLCHVAETLQNIGAGITLHCNVNFCSKFENVSAELPEVQPTLLLCVPRLWEKMMEGVMGKIDHGHGFKKNLAVWALSVGARVGEPLLFGKKVGFLDRLQWKIADQLVLSKIRQALGLAHAKALVSGAAALPTHVCKWFRSLGLEIMEDFGQTESTGIICMTERGVDCAGTVGKPVVGLEMKIAEDGEILTRGRHVFLGYFKDDAATAEALAGGWLHTGDLGELDKRGFVKIKGRKKEVLKTSGGKMIAPLPIEEALKAAPLISQVCMVGEGRKFLSALITLSESKLKELSKVNGALQNGVITAPGVVDEVKKYVDELNSSLASYEQIKKFVILSRSFPLIQGR